MKKLIVIIALIITADHAFSQTKPKTTDTARNAPVTSTTAFRVSFDKVFKRNSDGSFSPLQPVQINGDIMGSDVPFTRGTTFGGVDVASYAEHDLLIDTVKHLIIIRKIF
ncbi:MAG: hypothetical protein JWQ66_1438 [Mucilaginibacter sp.]|nr:hypothetical protein [Mucilaginibacter sp.]